MAETLFRFASVRSPQLVPAGSNVPVLFSHPELPASSTVLRRSLADARQQGAGRERLRELARDFLRTADAVVAIEDLAFPMAQVDQALVAGAFDHLAPLLGGPLSVVVAGENFRVVRARVADTLLAIAHQPEGVRRGGVTLMRALRVLGAIEALAAGSKAAPRRLLRPVVLLPGDAAPQRASHSVGRPSPAGAGGGSPDAAHNARVRHLRHRLTVLERGVDEAARALRRDRAGAATVDSPVGAPSPPSPVSRTLSPGAMATLSPATRALVESNAASNGVVELIAGWEEELRRIGSELYGGGASLAPSELAPVVESPPAIPPQPPPVPVPGPCAPPQPEPPLPPEPPPESAGAMRPIGIADLMLVEQNLERYEPGEVAHIENVLRGESKERTHRRARRREESTLVETESSVETERELETTDRFELQRESERVMSEDSQLQAGVTSTARYGDWLEVTATGDQAQNHAREDSQRTASTFARDIVNRASRRLRERVRHERQVRAIEEVEETNLHRLSNEGGSEHIVGIYRWVEKVYRARVLQYDARQVIEWVIPEPGALLRHLLGGVNSAAAGDPPELPVLCAGNGTVPLTPAQLTESNYQYWVARLRVPDVTPPPARYRILAAALSESEIKGISTKATSELTLPEGYQALEAHLIRAYGHAGESAQEEPHWLELLGVESPPSEPPTPSLTVFVGRHRIQPGEVAALDGEDQVVPLSIIAANLRAYVANIEVVCERTDRLFAEWQATTFQAIMTTYNERRSAWDAAVTAARGGVGDPIANRGPLRNRELLLSELRRTAITMLTGQHFEHLDATRASGHPFGFPELDLAEADREGRYIQFFEQAFEWAHLTYLLYPYFWARKSEWKTTALLENDDPELGAFLRAGAARVQVPVRPGFEEAVLYFFESGGDIWLGGDPPHLDEELFVSMVDEIKSQQAVATGEAPGRLRLQPGSPVVDGVGTQFESDLADRLLLVHGFEVQVLHRESENRLLLTQPWSGPALESAPFAVGPRVVGPSWLVRVPTSLVVLQTDGALP